MKKQLEMKRTSITRLKRNLGKPMQNNKHRLEMKRTSITRLKRLSICLRSFGGFFWTWNEKNLDYEIETWTQVLVSPVDPLTWNEKNLDYEIETMLLFPNRWRWEIRLKWKEPRLRDWNKIGWPLKGVFLSWNEKNLDYEIETLSLFGFLMFSWRVLKWKEPRLRDWNRTNHSQTPSSSFLEMKRTSITRLKP